MSEFGAQSTADEVLAGHDLSSRRVLITGTSAGLGVETARSLLARGALVVGAARDLDKAGKATAGLRDRYGERFSLVKLDLASQASTRHCADGILDRGAAFDAIIANAGIMSTPQGKTSDGFELQFGTNHLGHFTLLNRLAPLILPGGRVIVLSSSAHQFGPFNLDDPNYDTRPYDRFEAYGASKTANALFAVEFDRRHRTRGVRCAAVHPGSIKTELVRHMTPDLIEQMSRRSIAAKGDCTSKIALKSVAQGAATTVWAGFVADASEVGGRYCEDCQVAQVRETGASGVRSYAVDPVIAKQVWDISERLIDEQFPVQT